MPLLSTLTTPHLLLSPLTAADIPLIIKYASNSNISKNTQNLPSPYTEKDAIFWINLSHQGAEQGTKYIFAIRSKASEEFMGGIGLTIEKRASRAELGYWLAEPFWNQGFGTEAAKAMIAFGFDQLNLNKITSSHLARNPASGRVMQKAGMAQEGILRQQVRKDEEFHDLVVYGICKI